MSRKHKLTAAEQQRRRDKQERQQLETVVVDTAARFTCSPKIAADFAEGCEDAAEALEAELVFVDIAHDMWRDRTGPAGHTEEFLAILELLRAADEQHRQTLLQLAARFAGIAKYDDHEHLDPAESYYDFIRSQISGAPDAS
jgi:hypothetical protein